MVGVVRPFERLQDRFRDCASAAVWDGRGTSAPHPFANDDKKIATKKIYLPAKVRPVSLA
jgi:hypothetical protein